MKHVNNIVRQGIKRMRLRDQDANVDSGGGNVTKRKRKYQGVV